MERSWQKEIKMNWRNIVKTAYIGLTANKLRSVLTSLGIIIGVTSIIAMLALGNGARVAVESSYRFLGADTVQINRKQSFEDGNFEMVGKILSYEDGLLMAENVDLVNRVEMNVGGNGKIRFGRNVLDINVAGVTANVLGNLILTKKVQPVGWPEDQPLTPQAYLADGRFFTPSEVLAGANVCVLGHKTAQDLFNGDNPIGETVWVNRQRCLVIGVIAELESTDQEEQYRTQPNEGFYMPISAAINLLYEEEPSVYLTAHVTDEKKMDTAKAQIAEYLRGRHGVTKDTEGEYLDDFDLTTRKDILGAQQESANTFSLLLTAMATVSLIVGGIGIMNVMLVSVTERTREIGIRLAIGARQRDVIFQFLLEAIILSAGGGFLGVLFGVISIPLAATLNQGVAVLAIGSIPLAFGLALLTGVGFGLYPAIRAARLDPVEALRYE
jgi:putative ABC transport system permease protein